MRTINITLFILLSFQLNAQLPSFPSSKIWNGLQLDTIAHDVASIRIEYYDVEEDSIFLRKYWAVQQHIYRDGLIDSVHFIDQKDNSIYLSYFFDKKGRMKGQRRFNEEAWYPIINYVYDDKGLSSSEITYNSDSTLNSTTSIKYNNKLLKIKREEFNSERVLTRSWRYEYDSCNNLVLELYLNTPNGPGISAFGDSKEPWPNDTTTYRIEYLQGCGKSAVTKFSNSHLINRTTYLKSGDTLITRLAEFDFQGSESKLIVKKKIDPLRIERTTFVGLSDKSSFEYVYNQDFLIKTSIERKGEIQSEQSFRKEIVTDERGNWTVKKLYLNNNLYRITKRIITYN